MTPAEIFADILLALMVLGVGILTTFSYLMTCEVRHSIEDIKAAITILRDGKEPISFEDLEARKIPAKKGDLRFHIPNVLKAPFEL